MFYVMVYYCKVMKVNNYSQLHMTALMSLTSTAKMPDIKEYIQNDSIEVMLKN